MRKKGPFHAITITVVLSTIFVVLIAPTANANPTVSITTPSSVVKGLVTLNATPAADPAGTASLSYAGIKITGISDYSITLNNRGTPDYRSYSFGAAGTADYAWNEGNGNYQFNFDTTKWPTGSYQITVFTKDSSGRTAVSAPITLTIPKAVSLVLGVQSIEGNIAKLIVQVIGDVQIDDGRIALATSSQGGGEFREVTNFQKTPSGYRLDYQFIPGEWIQAQLLGSTKYLDSSTEERQLLSLPKISCRFASTARLKVRLTGSCTSSFALNNAPIFLQSNIGKGWVTIAQGTFSGSKLSPSIVPTQSGNLQVRLYSPGLSSFYSTFTSNIVRIKVS